MCALMEVLALAGELPEAPELTRLKFVASRALSLYDERAASDGGSPSK